MNPQNELAISDERLAPVAPSVGAGLFQVQPYSTFEANKAGAWTGVPMDAYQLLSGESHSLLTLLARSPRRYHMMRAGLISKPEPTHDMALGTMIHAAINEGKEPAYYIQPETYRAPESAKKDAGYVDKPWNMNANACKEWVAGHQDRPILKGQEALMLNSVTDCAANDPRVMKLLAGAWREVTACAYNPNLDAPYMLRCRFDILGHDDAGWYWVEVKSTRDASTLNFSWEIKKRLHYVQMALYRRVLRKLTGEDVRGYIMPVEKDAAIPRINVRQLADAAMDLGDKIIDERLALLHRCRLANKWPLFIDEEENDGIPFIDLPEGAYFDADEIEASETTGKML